MNIRFVSSLTPEDESRLASAIIGVVRGLLDPFDLPYTIRVETADGQLLHHSSAAVGAPKPAPVRASEAAPN
jgi:hypothetical protein